MSFDMRTLIFAIVVGFCAPAVAESCAYAAPDGRVISFPDTEYMVVHIGEDERWCQAAIGDLEAIVECPTDSGDVSETLVTFVEPGLVWNGDLFEKRCDIAPGYNLTPPENVF
jgi:hypothetical protein